MPDGLAYPTPGGTTAGLQEAREPVFLYYVKKNYFLFNVPRYLPTESLSRILPSRGSSSGVCTVTQEILNGIPIFFN